MRPKYITVLPSTQDLDAARGVILGLAISLGLWFVISFVVLWK